MALNIIKGTDPIKIEAINVLIYGQPGASKTSTAFTAKNPILLDFDKKIGKALFRQDAVNIDGWADVSKLDPNDFKPYDTIVIDTVGRALDYLSAEIIRSDAKLSRKTGELSLQGYGALKAAFTNWIKQLNNLGKDVVMLAHDKEEKDGDYTKVRPEIAGSSLNEVMKIADFVGYLHLSNETRVLNFNPTEKWYGKNSADFAPLLIPNVKSEPDKAKTFLADLIIKMKDSMGKIAEDQAESLKKLEECYPKIENAKTAEDLNSLMKNEFATFDKALKNQLWSKIVPKGKELKLEFDNQKKEFFNPAPEPQKVEEKVEQTAEIDLDF